MKQRYARLLLVAGLVLLGLLACPACSNPESTPTLTHFDLSGVIDGDGVVQEDIEYSTPDGTMGLEISSGTTARTGDGAPLQSVEVEVICVDIPPPMAGDYMVECAYDLAPEGATFDPPIMIVVHYDLALAPKAFAEESLVIAYYDVPIGQWVWLPSAVDTENHAITAEANHFTKFAVYAPAPTPTATPTPTPVPTPTPTPSPTPTPEACQADFTADQCVDTVCGGPISVQFTDLSTGDVSSWEWDFGDGKTNTEQNPSNYYSSNGDFTVILTVTGPGCPDGVTETKVDYIHTTGCGG